MVEHYTDLKSAGIVSVNSIRYSSQLWYIAMQG